MLQPDSETQGVSGDNVENIIGNSDVMNFDMIAEIEKELMDNPYDMVSLVFLLYDVPDTALQRLIVFQRVSNDPATSTNLNMLQEWFRHAKHNPNWKHEFLEALLICQLHSIVRKLGFNVPSACRYYQTDFIPVKMYVNPMKKALYKLCENINSDNLLKLKKALLPDIDTTEYEYCELVLLKLMCDKFITMNQYQYNKKVLGFKVDVEKLVRFVEHLPGLRKLVLEIEMLQQSMNDEPKPGVTVTTSTRSEHIKVGESRQEQADQNFYPADFNDEFLQFENLQIDETFKSDRKQSDMNCYDIKNQEKVGTCVIINQENFHSSKYSIEVNAESTSLDQRVGSDKDLMLLEKTMRSFNFTVHSGTDLGHIDMLKFIMDVVMNKVSEDDSVFMLCILSHGVRGQVYAADSVKVQIDDIQDLLDCDAAEKIHHIPKLLIIQACQDNEASPALVADSPKVHIKKSDFLIFYATAPTLLSYRNVETGSVFIQNLCEFISKYANVEHIYDIFTRVNLIVKKKCLEAGYVQVPIIHTTLDKSLYLKVR